MKTFFKNKDLVLSSISQIAVLVLIAIALMIEPKTALAFVLMYISGWLDGLMDTVAVSAYYEKSILQRINPVIFKNAQSWIWKYKNGKSQNGEAFFGAKLLFTAITDYWHFAKTLKIVVIGFACMYSPAEWYTPILFFTIYLTGKQLMWNLILPLPEGKNLNIIQIIVRAILVIPFYVIWQITTRLSNKDLRKLNDTRLFI